MAKSLDAPYEAGNRGASWLKIKRAHTLDLVVLAAEWGHGRRTGKLSNLHLGALDPATGEYVMLGKTFKGLTDAMLEWQTQELLAREIRRDPLTVYVRPELVVEIAFSDLQASPRYPGGLALRLARVKRYRDDKRAEEADTMDAVRRIFAAQQISCAQDRPSCIQTTPGEALDLDRALSLLARDERLCIVLAYNEGMSHGEISAATALPLGAVKSTSIEARNACEHFAAQRVRVLTWPAPCRASSES